MSAAAVVSKEVHTECKERQLSVLPVAFVRLVLQPVKVQKDSAGDLSDRLVQAIVLRRRYVPAVCSGETALTSATTHISIFFSIVNASVSSRMLVWLGDDIRPMRPISVDLAWTSVASQLDSEPSGSDSVWLEY